MEMGRFHYTYILESLSDPGRHYVGFTENLTERLTKHNEGGNPHTARYRPWRIKTAVAFTCRDQALAFERYLKSPSGRAFARKRL
jgi:predicted GIY-YIG superfamily endonuclease